MVDRAELGGGRGMRDMTAGCRRWAAGGGPSAPGEGTTVEGTVPLPAESRSTTPPAPAPWPSPSPARSAAVEQVAASPVAETSVAGTVDAETDEPVRVEPMTVAAVTPAGHDHAVVRWRRRPPPSTKPTSLAGQVRELVRSARAAYRGSPTERRLDELAHRLDEPLRIAVLATVDDGRRMLVEALIGTPDVPRPHDGGRVQVRYAFGDDRRTLAPGPDDVRRRPGRARPAGDDDHRRSGSRSADPAPLGPPGDAPMADAVVLLLHYGPPADLALLDLLDAAGHRGAIAVLAVADEAGAVAERAVREFGDDPAVRRVCHAVVPVAPATAVAAARLGDDEHRRLRQWVASTPRRARADPTEPAAWPMSSPRRAPDRRRSRPRRPPRPSRRSPPRCSSASARSARAGPCGWCGAARGRPTPSSRARSSGTAGWESCRS